MKKIILSLAMVLTFSSSLAFGALYTVDMVNFPNPSQVENLLVEFNVANDFVYVSDSFAFGTAVPFVPNDDPNLFPWTFAEPDLNNNIFTIDLYNGDSFDGFFPSGFNKDSIYSENNLMNGVVATFEYTGTITGINFFRFGSSGTPPVPYSDMITAIENTDGVTFDAVPIPSTILLLGGGLVALAGLRRRKSS